MLLYLYLHIRTCIMCVRSSNEVVRYVGGWCQGNRHYGVHCLLCCAVVLSYVCIGLRYSYVLNSSE